MAEDPVFDSSGTHCEPATICGAAQFAADTVAAGAADAPKAKENTSNNAMMQVTTVLDLIFTAKPLSFYASGVS